MSPVCDNITTTSSGITSAISFSSFGTSICANSVLLASPYFLTKSSNLPKITFNCSVSEPNILFKSSIVSFNLAFSSLSSTPSSLAKLPNLIATIDFA